MLAHRKSKSESAKVHDKKVEEESKGEDSCSSSEESKEYKDPTEINASQKLRSSSSGRSEGCLTENLYQNEPSEEKDDPSNKTGSNLKHPSERDDKTNWSKSDMTEGDNLAQIKDAKNERVFMSQLNNPLDKEAVFIDNLVNSRDFDDYKRIYKIEEIEKNKKNKKRVDDSIPEKESQTDDDVVLYGNIIVINSDKFHDDKILQLSTN